MEQYKLELWEGSLPKIDKVDKNHIIELKQKLCNVFFKKDIKKCERFYEAILKYEISFGDIDSIDLFNILKKCDGNLSIDEYIYLDWGNFENLILVNINDFINNINNFWYPGSDDLSIFDESCNWVLFIHHDENVGCAKSHPIKIQGDNDNY